MSFACLICHQVRSLVIVASIELPPDVRSDEIVLQVLECEVCGFNGLAIYEESRRGALDSETWEHTGYVVPERRVEWIKDAIQQCPDPVDPSCECPTHRAFGQVDRLGRWQAPEGISGAEPFAMRLSAPQA